MQSNFHLIRTSDLQYLYHASASGALDAIYRECRVSDFLYVELLVDYLLIRLHGVVVWEYGTIFDTEYFIILIYGLPNAYIISSSWFDW